MSERAAQRFINVAKVFAGKYATVAYLPLKALYGLAFPSTSEDVRAEGERRVATGY